MGRVKKQKKNQNTFCPHFPEKKICATRKILTNCITYPKFGEHFFDLGQKISKIRYHYFQNWHFWTLDGIFEIKMIKKICLGVIRFEIRQSELEILTCWNQLTLGAPFSKEGRETCCFLLPRASLYLYLTQNINGCPGIIFVWIRQMINQAEPSV